MNLTIENLEQMLKTVREQEGLEGATNIIFSQGSPSAGGIIFLATNFGEAMREVDGEIIKDLFIQIDTAENIIKGLMSEQLRTPKEKTNES